MTGSWDDEPLVDARGFLSSGFLGSDERAGSPRARVLAGAGAVAAGLGVLEVSLQLAVQGTGTELLFWVLVVAVYAVGVPVSLRLRRVSTDPDSWLVLEHLRAGLWWGGGLGALVGLPGFFAGYLFVGALLGAGLGAALAVLGALAVAAVPRRARVPVAVAGPLMALVALVLQLT